MMVIAAYLASLWALICAVFILWRLHQQERDSRAALEAEDGERRYNILEAIPDGVYIIDLEERITHVNDEAERLLVGAESPVGRTLESILDPLASDLIPEIRKARETKSQISRTVYFPARDWWIEIRIKPGAFETVVYLRDVTVRRSAEERLAESESRLRMMMGQVPAVLWSVDRIGRFASLSGAGVNALELDVDALLGTSCGPFLASEDAARVLMPVFDGEPLRFDAPRGDRWLRHDIEPLRGKNGTVVGAVGVTIDVTEMKQTQTKLENAARRDALTGLPNRRGLEELLQATLLGGEQSRNDAVSAVLFIDLDRFKMINDTFGHPTGDELLRIVAERMRSSVTSSDVVARQGGDEFIILLTSVSTADDVSAIGNRILRRCKEPIVIDGNELYVSASVGAALWPQHGTSAEELIAHADSAMYAAKAAARGTFAFFHAGMAQENGERASLEGDLRRALAANELHVLYQPIVEVETGLIVGGEALLRWHHARLGELGAASFIPLAEESGLITEITPWVLSEACMFGAAVRKLLPEFRVAVNLSPCDLRQPSIVEIVQRALAESSLPPAGLEIEITENVLLEESALSSLAQIRELGVLIAIDDFGTAYNSLSYVKQLPVTSVKIDRSFVQNVVGNHYDQAIVKAIATLAASLQIRVVAEGVETPAQLQFIRNSGCHEAQGFHFSRPIDPRGLELLLMRSVSYPVPAA